jgi:hypothetical protein
VLSIQIPQTIATAQPAGGTGGNLATRQDLFNLAPFSLALLLLPFAGRLRKSGKRLGRLLTVLLLLGAGMAALAGLSGCGSSNGFFATGTAELHSDRDRKLGLTVAQHPPSP